MILVHSLFLCCSFTLLLCHVQSWSFEKPLSRRDLGRKTTTALIAGGTFVSTTKAQAAPPIAVIAEELGYFPVQNKDGEVTYIPKRVQRQSSDQAIELAKRLKERGLTMYGAYWCPHCSRQKELFGAEAWSYINYQECSPKGYGFRGICKNVDGYPTFKDKKGKLSFSGERPLEYFAAQVGYDSFDPSLETPVPQLGNSACKIPKPTNAMNSQ